MFKLYFMIIFSTFVFAQTISPLFELKSSGFVSDIVVVEDKLYSSTDMGSIDIFDINSKKIVHQILLPLVTSSTTNTLQAPRILSVDYYNGKVLILSIGSKGYRNLWIYENYKLRNIVNESDKYTIKEACFVDDEKIIFGTFGSDIVLRDTKEKFNVYKSHISQSTIGDILLNDSKDTLFMADESGTVLEIDVITSEIINTYDSQNVDNIYSIAYANGVLITGGQDRRVGVYQKDEKAYHIKSTFMVHAVGITPSGKVGAYSNGNTEKIHLFNTATKKEIGVLIGHKSNIIKIVFINERRMISIDQTQRILVWDISF